MTNLTELKDRIDAAIKRIQDGHGAMRVPADLTDPDIVLAECRELISEVERLKVAAWRPLDVRQGHADYWYQRAGELFEELRATQRREERLREGLEMAERIARKESERPWERGAISEAFNEIAQKAARFLGVHAPAAPTVRPENCATHEWMISFREDGLTQAYCRLCGSIR